MIFGILAALASFPALPSAHAQGSADGFGQWLAAFRAEAIASGIRAETVDHALKGVTYDPSVIALDNKQPEFVRSFAAYFASAVTEDRVAQGRAMIERHQPLFEKIFASKGVASYYLTAFWALESNFGANTGDYSVIRSLATLAYDPRRSDLFRAQLLDALRLVDRGIVPLEKLRGSWAGAMGQTQFMPSDYLARTIDFDGDGKRDMWNSIPDILGSSAHYLQSLGWKKGQLWGQQVRLPKTFQWQLAEPSAPLPLSTWRKMGVQAMDGKPLPPGDQPASIVLPMGHRGPAFLLYDNFQVILKWNRSLHYALAVGLLADRLAGRPGLIGSLGAEASPLKVSEVEEIQQRLTALGFDTGDHDGRVGPATRTAIRNYQLQTGLPADGYADRQLLRRLRGQ